MTAEDDAAAGDPPAMSGEVLAPCAPNCPPEIIDRDNPARWMFQQLVRQIQDFEGALSKEQELGIRLVHGPGDMVFHVQDLAWWGPDLIVFSGIHQGRPVRLVQHYSQLSMLLTAVPKIAEAPRRIGFVLEGRAREAATPVATAGPAQPVEGKPVPAESA